MIAGRVSWAGTVIAVSDVKNSSVTIRGALASKRPAHNLVRASAGCWLDTAMRRQPTAAHSVVQLRGQAPRRRRDFVEFSRLRIEFPLNGMCGRKQRSDELVLTWFDLAAGPRISARVKVPLLAASHS